nr:hypothetical protein [Nocardia wallacei]
MQYIVIAAEGGKKYGPYLTAVEARMKLMEIGGGAMKQVPAE